MVVLNLFRFQRHFQFWEGKNYCRLQRGNARKRLSRILKVPQNPFWTILYHFVPILTHLGPFWIIFGRFWPNLDRFWPILDHFGPFSPIVGRFWSDFDQFWSILEYLVPMLNNDFGPFWTDFEEFWRILVHFVPNLTDFGPFGPILDRFWAEKAPNIQFNLDQRGSKLGLNRPKMIQNGPKWVKIGTKWYKMVQNRFWGLSKFCWVF